MEKQTLTSIYSRWCELRKSGVNLSFAQFVEQEKESQEYNNSSKIIYSSYSIENEHE